MSQKVSELECFGGEGTTESGSEEGPLVPWGRIRGTMELTSRERSQERGDRRERGSDGHHLLTSFAHTQLCSVRALCLPTKADNNYHDQLGFSTEGGINYAVILMLFKFFIVSLEKLGEENVCHL